MSSDLTNDELLRDLARRFDRMERAILGDHTVGHLGAIERLNQIDAAHLEVPEVHRQMESDRLAGDRRLHDRIDAHEDDTRSRLDSIEKKLDRSIWLLVGTGLGGALAGGSAVWAILGGV